MCQCDKKFFRVRVRRGNYSAFNGYKFTSSDYSALHCLRCGDEWRTKAEYVRKTPDLREAEYEAARDLRQINQIYYVQETIY
jgi:hypothetical protein